MPKEIRLLIAGIDPGATVGMAFFDLNENLVAAVSQKDQSLDDAVKESVKYGKVIVVGTDKKNIPSFVEKFAARTGAKIVSPKEDLRVDEKQSLAKGFEYQNSHEMDAIASAMIALKEYSRIIEKINSYCKEMNITDNQKIARIIELVIKNEFMNIKLATDLVLKPEDNNTKIIQKVIEKKEFSKDYAELYDALRKQENEIFWLKKQNKGLLHEWNNARKQIESLKKKFQNIRLEDRFIEQIKNKEKIIYSLQNQIEILNNKLHEMNRKSEKLMSFIERINDYLVIKKLANLGRDETRKIKDENIIFVENLAEFSTTEVKALSERIKYIIAEKYPKKFPIPVIDASKLEVEKVDGFCFILKKSIEKEERKLNILSKIIEEYKNKRDYT